MRYSRIKIYQFYIIHKVSISSFEYTVNFFDIGFKNFSLNFVCVNVCSKLKEFSTGRIRICCPLSQAQLSSQGCWLFPEVFKPQGVNTNRSSTVLRENIKWATEIKDKKLWVISKFSSLAFSGHCSKLVGMRQLIKSYLFLYNSAQALGW